MKIIQILFAVLLFCLGIFILIKLISDKRKANATILENKDLIVIRGLQITNVYSKSFFLERDISVGYMHLYLENDFIYLYFSSNFDHSYSNGPYIISNSNNESKYWLSYYLDDLKRTENGATKLEFSTKNNLLYSKFKITINEMNIQDFELLKNWKDSR